MDARRASLAIAKNFDLAVAGACTHSPMLCDLHSAAGLHVCCEACVMLPTPFAMIGIV